MKAAGAFPMEIGTRFTTEHGRKNNLPANLITGYYVNPKNPESYGYRVRREFPSGDWDETHSLIRDPKLEALHGPEKWEEIQRGIIPMTGPRVVKEDGGEVREGYAGKGRVAKGIADEVVGLAKRILGSEPEVRKVTGAELLKKTEGLSEDPFGYSKFAKPLSEMEYTVKMLPREEYKTIDPYDLVRKNATIAGHISDRTAAGREITNIGGVDLTEPLRQRGGADYQRTTPYAWANRPGAGKTLNKKLNEAAKGLIDTGEVQADKKAPGIGLGAPPVVNIVSQGSLHIEGSNA